MIVDILKMSPCAFDPSSLFKAKDSKLCGITGLAIDYFINTGNDDYQANEKQATEAFITKKNNVFPLRFLVFIIEYE